MNAIGNNSILTLSRLWKDVMGVLGIVLLASCSETASVPEGDQLYTGQRKIKYENYKASDHFSTTQEEVEAALATEPNGAIFGSSYYPRHSLTACGYTTHSTPATRVWADGYARLSARHLCS